MYKSDVHVRRGGGGNQLIKRIKKPVCPFGSIVDKDVAGEVKNGCTKITL